MNEKLIFEFLNQGVVMNLVLLPNNIHAACVVVGVKLLNEKVHRGRSTILCRMPVRVCYWAAKEPFQPIWQLLSLQGTPAWPWAEGRQAASRVLRGHDHPDKPFPPNT